MKSLSTLPLLSALGLLCAVTNAEVATEFSAKPTATKESGKAKISFALAKQSDVEVAVLNADGKVVRHLAAGLIGASVTPAAPLSSGLAQQLVWDGKNDFGKPAQGGPFKIRIRAGSKARFGRFIGEDPYTFGGIHAITTDQAGNLYVMAYRGGLNQNMDTLRVFNPDGGYLRTLIPFPANMKAERIGAAATWHETLKRLVPKNTRSQLPQFYPWGAGAHIVSASEKGGIVLSHGTRIYRMDLDGGNIRGPFPMWSKAAKLQNPKWNIPQLAVSPDGRYIYYANVAGTKYKPKGFSDTDPAWPQGRVYRQDSSKEGSDPQTFYDLKLPDWNQKKYWIPDAWNKRTAAYGITVDPKGHLYICDLVNQQIVEVDPEGKTVSATPAPWPERIHVDPQSGDYYVICRLDRPKDGYVDKKLIKITGRGSSGKLAAELPLKKWRGLGASSALGQVEGKAVLWLGGGGALICVKDAGAAFEVVTTSFAPRKEAQQDWNRIAVDHDRNEIYTSNGGNLIYRYDGQTGKGEILKKKGQPFHGVDLAVGYDGLLYCRTGKGYSGPLQRFTRDLEPAPFPSGSHILTKYIYSRYGVGNCEKGLGVGPQGQTYINFMYGWNKYFIAGFDGKGQVIKGKYLAGAVKPDPKRGGHPDLTSAVVGPIPAACGGIRVDLQGNLYIGLRLLPKDFKSVAGFEKNNAYNTWTGCIAKFHPEGGTVLQAKESASVPGTDKPPIQTRRGMKVFGALKMYSGIGPFSGDGYGGAGSCCVCRVPRFDIDRYGRICYTNAVTNDVSIIDNAGNLVANFGQYGNFDSQFVNPNLEAGQGKKATVDTPEIPLAWPTGAGFSADHVYVNDSYNRRIVRVDFSYDIETVCPLK